MSHVAYDLQWSDAMNDLQDTRKVEEIPNDLTSNGTIELPW